MPSTRGTSSPFIAAASQEVLLQCPYKDYDNCKNGVGGRGLGRSSFIRHLNDRHFINGIEYDRCRERLRSDSRVFLMWEEALTMQKSWLCTACMHIHGWRKPCSGHLGDVVAAPYNGTEADFLIHGIDKPSDDIVADKEDGEILAPVDTQLGLTVDLLDAVFRLQVRTIRFIPAKCKLSFSRNLMQAIDKVVLNPRDTQAWIKLLLFPICILRNYVAKNRQEEKSGNRRRLQTASITQALTRWRDTQGCLSMIQEMMEEFQSHKHTPSSKKKDQDDINRRLCKRKLGQGCYTAAIRVLTSQGVAPEIDATMAELQLKHPYAPPPSIPLTPPAAAPVVATKEMVLTRLRSFPKGTSCGRDGLHAQHIVDAMNGSAAAVADELLTSITALVNVFLAGNCPKQLGEYIASAPLTPLIKPGGGVRPIAVGTIWRRLVSKVAAQAVSKDMNAYFDGIQFGVGVQCGGEAILHSVNRILEEKGTCNSLSMLLVDFRNAFNMVDRTAMLREVRNQCPSIAKWVEFCYGSPAKLYYGASTLVSALGVQQGDPLGPLLFSLTLHPIALQLSKLQLELQAWYLDDGTIIGDSAVVSQALDIIRREGVAVGLDLNEQKTELFWPTPDARNAHLFPPGISRPTDGVKLLGGPVSMDADYCSSMVTARVHKTIQLMEAVRKLDDPQCELLLLRNCTGVSRLYFTMRTTSPTFVREGKAVYDKYLFAYLRQLVVCDGQGFGALQQRLVSLPIREGGLGIYSMTDTSCYCYIASCIQSTQLQRTLLLNSGISPVGYRYSEALAAYAQVCGLDFSSLSIYESAPHPMKTMAAQYFAKVMVSMPSTYGMSQRDRVLWQCNKTKHAQDYLLAIPADGLRQHIGPRQFCAILGYRLGIPLFAEGSKCLCCDRDMDIYGDHAMHCAHEVGLKFRHDLVRDTFADICYRAGVHSKTEAALGFLSSIGSESRPADILVYNWDNGRDICFDVTGISPFTGGVQTFAPGLAVSKAVDRKRKKYLDICEANGYSFGTLAFTTMGELGDETIEFLTRLRNVLARHDVSNSGDFIFIRIGLAIQKGVGAQLVARLPTCSV